MGRPFHGMNVFPNRQRSFSSFVLLFNWTWLFSSLHQAQDKNSPVVLEVTTVPVKAF